MSEKPSTLVVVVPGLKSPARTWDSLLAKLKREPHLEDGKAVRWEVLRQPVTRWSFKKPQQVAVELKATIDAIVAKHGPFEHIILVGHSNGGVLIRQAYLLAANAYSSPGNPPSGSWSSKVDKFVFFACLSRGINPESSLLLRIGIPVFRLIGVYRWMTIRGLMRGAAFITDVRLAWIRHLYQLSLSNRDPVVAQLLGTRDTLIRRDDCLDLEQFPNAEVIDIPKATHGDLHQLDKTPDPEGRYALISRAFQPDYRSPTATAARVEPKHSDVVFILHGIRASNIGWVEEMSSHITRTYPHAQPITATYGFFSALHFFTPWVRQSRSRWFQDCYSEAVAAHPNPATRFHFIGHSNGTYMLGRGLKEVSMMRFDRAYLAGSVLPASYDWTGRMRNGQVKQVRSDCSAWDWPVGLLCSALQFMQDIGTGGFSGFKSAPTELHEYRYYPGGHGKPLEDSKNIEAIAAFVMTGADTRPTGLRKPSALFAGLSNALRYFGPVLFVVILGYTAWLFWTYSAALTLTQWIVTAAVIFSGLVALLSF